MGINSREFKRNAIPKVTARSVRDRYNLLTKRMQAKLTMEEKTTGIDVETSELDALPEEVLEKEKELIILNEI